ncbi:MAG: hypothetical protein AAGF86_20985, partial [Pseudomonadota bacterium]
KSVATLLGVGQRINPSELSLAAITYFNILPNRCLFVEISIAAEQKTSNSKSSTSITPLT